MRYIITGTYQDNSAYAEDADTVEQVIEILRQLTAWAGPNGEREVYNIKIETEE